MASNVAAGRPEHRQALVGHGAPAALTSLLQSDQLDLQQEAAHGIWNIVAHDQELLLQASRDDRVMGAYVALVRAQSPPVVRCVVVLQLEGVVVLIVVVLMLVLAVSSSSSLV